ncbi:magnesium transporter [Candidatus Pacearchaeota archaeon]|nr:magnesium transporter [Candidatus Pacearchaeota archaeon]
MIFDKNFKDILASSMISTSGGLFAGIILAIYADKIFLIPGILVLLPGFLEMRGNISGTLSARISSGLFIHVIKPNHIKTKIIKGNVIAALFLALIISFSLGLFAFAFNYYIFGIFTTKIILLPLIAGVIANLIEVPLALFTTLYLFKKGHDPNNIMGPFVSATGDITSIIALLLALVIV